MDATIRHYIASQLPERQAVLKAIHVIIFEEDKTVVSVLEPMMGKEMILYKAKGLMKYGLAAGKNYMSLHVLPIYGSASLYTTYKLRLHKANFQKGCINFNAAEKMPLEVVRQLIIDCSKIDLLKMKEEYFKQKKMKAK